MAGSDTASITTSQLMKKKLPTLTLHSWLVFDKIYLFLKLHAKQLLAHQCVIVGVQVVLGLLALGLTNSNRF